MSVARVLASSDVVRKGRMKSKVRFITGFGPIVRDREASRRLYAEDLGLSFVEEAGGYLHTEKIEGARTFALWPLAQAARSCFGTDTWPSHVPIPQAWLEFDVDDVEAESKQLEARGYQLLVSARREPWGQVVTRLLSPEGLLIGVAYTPAMRAEKR
jgi:catechol 2,3-dioxygenase-like lactoylglutathione lyase family enzyme